MKGLFKGFRYISQIFDEEKEQEMQIGMPTDVKHVAHIGWDGPAVESPSWMKEFKSAGNGMQSAPLGPSGAENPKDGTEVKWVSEDSKRSQKGSSSRPKDLLDLPKSSRRPTSQDNSTNDQPSMRKDSASKSRQSRRNHNKDSSEGGTKSGQESAQESGLPDAPKKSRRKKSKELVSGDGPRKSRSKGTASYGTHASSSPNIGPDSGPGLHSSGSQLSLASSIDEEREGKSSNF